MGAHPGHDQAALRMPGCDGDQWPAVGVWWPGENWSGSETSVEVFDPSTNTWDASKIGSMTTERHGHAFVVLDGELYAVGGNDYETSAEKFDPRSNSWSDVYEIGLGMMDDGLSGRAVALLK